MATNARAANNGTKISQMTPLQTVPGTAEVPVVVGVSNFRASIANILKNVTKATVGLEKVENLAPSEMPVSTLQQQALDKKLDKDAKIPQSQVINLPEDLEELRNRRIPVSMVDGFDQGVQTVIDRQPPPEFPVTQGIHAW